MPTPMDPTSTGFLFAENRSQPMHVGGLQLFRKPEGAGRTFVKDLYEEMLTHDDPAPLFRKRPHRSVSTAGQWFWTEDEQFDIEYHVRHSALPKPGRIRELLDLCGRLHSTRLALERPLWEVHVIEGLRDGRVGIYSKMHHALIDGVSSMRLMQSVLSPGALVRTLSRGVRNETSAVSLYAPRTIINKRITGSRRFAAEDWPLDRLRAIGAATGTTLNDVVLAMCSGAMRAYLDELGELPDTSLVAMVPVALKAKSAQSGSPSGGNAVGSVMVKLGTDQADPADRLQSVHDSMVSGKEALGAMTPAQILAMSALGLAPAVLGPMLKMDGVTRPPFNLIISNVPGPKETLHFNGARLEGMYPLSIPIHGMGLNITCTSYAGNLGFGLTGCRRTVPRLQRLLTHLDDEVVALEEAAGV